MHRSITMALLASLVAVSPAYAACPGLDPAGLQRLVKTRGTVRLVFFASWCGECAEHLRGPQPNGTVLIATFDERERAEAVVASLHSAAPCYVDEGVAASLTIKAVPAVRIIDRQGVHNG